MARLTGPLLSASASGTLAGVLTYQTHGKRSHVRRKTTPSQPHTHAQRSRREIVRYAGIAWHGVLTEEDRASWTDPDAGKAPTAYNRFTASLAKSWLANAELHERFAPTTAASAPGYTAIPTVTGAVRAALWTIDIFDAQECWLHALLLCTDPSYADYLDAITDIRDLLTLGPTEYLARDLHPGTYSPIIFAADRYGTITVAFFPPDITILT